MAGTVIDSFVVELGLDPTKFTQGQQQAFNAAKRLEDQQLAVAKNVEHGSDRAAQAIGGIRTQALQMLAVFTGGRGLVNFATELTHVNAGLGRLERNIGVSVSTINAWQGAARLFGGDAKQMAQSFQNISDAFAGWKIGVENPLIADLRAISTAGGTVIDVNKGVEQSFKDLAANLKAIHDRDPATAGLLGRRVGLDPALHDLLIRGPEAIEKVLEYMRKLGVATNTQTDAFGELEKRISQMGLKAESLGRKLLGGDPQTGEGGFARQIIEMADFLNMKPGEANAKFWSRESWSWVPGLAQDKPRSSFEEQKMFPGGRGKFTSQTEKEQYIRAAAARRGINPNVAMAVAKSEGFNSFQSTVPSAKGPNGREDSWGAFQLYKGGGLGNEFQKATGLDPADPANERATIDFALDDARKNGWKAFHGARNTGIGNWAGIDRGAGGGGGSTTTTEVNINGPINVTPPANSDPATFADRFAAAVKQQSFTAQANGGQQ